MKIQIKGLSYHFDWIILDMIFDTNNNLQKKGFHWFIVINFKKIHLNPDN